MSIRNRYVRSFWLTNNTGAVYDLSDASNSAYLITPEGLGATAQYATARIGDSELLTGLQWSLEPITGTLYFGNLANNTLAYSTYKRFMAFAAQGPLILHYKTPDMSDTHYICDVILVASSKTDISTDDGTLVVPVQFKPLSMWRPSERSVMSVEADSSAGKSYPKKYSFAYSSGSLSGIRLVNTSDQFVPLLVEVIGTASNPQWTIVDNNGSAYGKCRIVGTYDYVAVDAGDLTESILLKTGIAFEPNAISKQDLSVGVPGEVMATFLMLKPGISFISFALGGGFGGKVQISWSEQYATV